MLPVQGRDEIVTVSSLGYRWWPEREERRIEWKRGMVGWRRNWFTGTRVCLRGVGGDRRSLLNFVFSSTYEIPDLESRWWKRTWWMVPVDDSRGGWKLVSLFIQNFERRNNIFWHLLFSSYLRILFPMDDSHKWWINSETMLTNRANNEGIYNIHRSVDWSLVGHKFLRLKKKKKTLSLDRSAVNLSSDYRSPYRNKKKREKRKGRKEKTNRLWQQCVTDPDIISRAKNARFGRRKCETAAREIRIWSDGEPWKGGVVRNPQINANCLRPPIRLPDNVHNSPGTPSRCK